ncbi:unnamed protein product [Ixodes hexagonus]
MSNVTFAFLSFFFIDEELRVVFPGSRQHHGGICSNAVLLLVAVTIALVAVGNSALSANVACPLASEAEWCSPWNDDQDLAAEHTQLVLEAILCCALLEVHFNKSRCRLNILESFHPPRVSGHFVHLPVRLQGPPYCVVAYVNRYPVQS